MLKIYYGDMADVIYNTAVYFKFNYSPSWLEDEIIKQMIPALVCAALNYYVAMPGRIATFFIS